MKKLHIGAIEWIGPVVVYPGEDELQALAEGALRVLRGEEEPCEPAASDRVVESC